jgi:rhamnulokinase
LKRSNHYRVAAVDLGAESGRVVVGEYDGASLDISVAHRFANGPIETAEGLRWDFPRFFSETLAGLRRAGEVSSVGVDAWGCDYALLDGANEPLAEPFHYRDQRTEGLPSRAFELVPREELYQRTGIQQLRFNTVFQLLADVEAGLSLDRAERIALIPDLVSLHLSGTLVNEATVASTTGLTSLGRRSWEQAVVARLGLPAAPFAQDLVEPGTVIGRVARRFRFDPEPVVCAVAGHDTASAFAAAPLHSPDAAVISCGTWSLVGLELLQPCSSADAADANLSNEWGVDGTIRLLRNVMGLWLLQECRRHWEHEDSTPVHYRELELLAEGASDDVPVFDPDLDRLLSPGGMPSRIADACFESGQKPPRDRAELVRSILISLACAYRRVLDDLERVTGQTLSCVQIVGGGALNRLLCQLTADVTQLPVLAGPVEAAATGNLLLQLRTLGGFGSSEEMQACVAQSLPPRRFEPSKRVPHYERFLSITHGREGLSVHA